MVVLGVVKALTEESIPSFRAKQWHHVGGRYGHMKVSKMRGPYFKAMAFRCLYWLPPIYGNYHVGVGRMYGLKGLGHILPQNNVESGN